nr:MAG TPA: hypothetical protein [Caudoviricetes sp.]
MRRLSKLLELRTSALRTKRTARFDCILAAQTVSWSLSYYNLE